MCFFKNENLPRVSISKGVPNVSTNDVRLPPTSCPVTLPGTRLISGIPCGFKMDRVNEYTDVAEKTDRNYKRAFRV